MDVDGWMILYRLNSARLRDLYGMEWREWLSVRYTHNGFRLVRKPDDCGRVSRLKSPDGRIGLSTSRPYLV